MQGSGGVDVVVVGLGGMGSAAAYHLARRGARVLGVDANPPGHALGSSHGTSRIIRKAIYEAPEYVPLVLRAYDLWRDLEAASGRPLLTITGRLLLGPPDSRTVRGMLHSARTHGLAHEVLDAAAVRARFPGFAPDEEMVGVHEPDGGMLDPEGCIAAHLDLAARHGARLRHGEGVVEWAASGCGVRVRLASGERVVADRLVLAAGPWLPRLAAELRLPLQVTRQTIAHFEPRLPERFSLPSCPVFGLQTPLGQFYGTPAGPGVGLKIGQHNAGEPCTPETVRRAVAAPEVEHLRAVLDRYLPGAAGRFERALSCLYTHTPDGHFIIDRHPEQPQISFVSACSGHGYKYCAVIGEIMAELALEGATRHRIALFRAGRFTTAPTAD